MTPAPDLPLAPSRSLGRTGILVSPLCLGGNVFGWTADKDESFAVLDAYVAAGGNFIDTADTYSAWVTGQSGGESESIIGEWLTARGNRADIIIATKVGKLPSAPGLAPDNIRRSLDSSLERLQTDHVDLYYAHRDDDSVPMLDVLATFDDVVRSGRVRHIAASNFTPQRLREALELQAANGLAPYVATQDLYNLMERARYEEELAPVVLEHGLASLPFYGLARGFLTGKYQRDAAVDSPRAEAARAYVGERGDRVQSALRDVADAHGCAVAAVALAWLLARPGVTAPIASARTPGQLRDLLPLGRLTLADEELATLDAASA